MDGQLTDEQIVEFQQAFARFDIKGDSYITFQELMSIMLSLGHNQTHAELRKIFNEFDLDGTGEIDFPQYMSLMARKMKGTDAKKEMIKACKEFDREGNGLIPAAELRHVMRNFCKNYRIKRLMR